MEKRTNLLEALTDNIVIDRDRCTACGKCVETCILDNLRMKLAPCRHACPLGVNCQGYVQLIARGMENESLEMVREALPFPGIIGRVCSQPCEDACHRKEVDGEAVAIRALKRYLYETAGPSAAIPEVERKTGKTVAVIGTGPAGLLAAWDLAVRGHGVVMFDRKVSPGGMLRWAIPEYRLPVSVLDEEISLLVKLGVSIRCGVEVGTDLTLEELAQEYDAVIAASGCPKPRLLKLPGEELPGVIPALTFLKNIRSGIETDLRGNTIVIGGGNAAVDAARSALRVGAEIVTMVALEEIGGTPAFPWELEEARREGVAVEHSWGPVGFIENNGRAAGVEFQKCTSVYDETGAFSPCLDSCEIMNLEADTVITAVGQDRETAVLAANGLLVNGIPAADAVTLQSAEEKIFFAGDLFTGPSSVIDAMASGRKAAESVHRFLAGEHLTYGRTYRGPVELDFDIDTGRGSSDGRVSLPCNAAGKGDFSEAEGPLSMAAARKEAARCLSCGEPFGKYRTCWFCLPCEVECPHEALWVEIPYLLR